MDPRRAEGQISWLRKVAQDEGGFGEGPAGDSAQHALDDPQAGQSEISDPAHFGRHVGVLALINEILNSPDYIDVANTVPGSKDRFEGLAEELRRNEVETPAPDVIDAINSVPTVVPSMFRDTQFDEFFEQLSQTAEDADVMAAQQTAIATLNDANERRRITGLFQNLYSELTQNVINTRTPLGMAPLPASSWTKLTVTAQGVPAEPMPPAVPAAQAAPAGPAMEPVPEMESVLPTPLGVSKYQGLEALSEDLVQLGPYEATYEKILGQVDDEETDSAKAALTAFFQGFPEGLCTLYSILVKAGVAEPLDRNLVERIMEQHPQLEDDKAQEEARVAKNHGGLFLPPEDSGLYTTPGASERIEKTASGSVGGTSPSYYTHGPGENKFCPKLRNMVNSFVCRYHCLDGLPIDDHQILCGEAIWRQAVMDKFSRDYKDADGNYVGGYLNKRFEIERNTNEHPYQLKPGQRSAPINEDAWSQERRLQEMRRSEGSKREYSDTPGDPKGLYNWDPYDFHDTTKNPQVFEKKKDLIAKIASKESMWDDRIVKNSMNVDRENYFDAAQGLYWYAANYHGGQSSPLYSILSTLGYSPGHTENGPDEMGQMFYEALERGELDPEDLYRQIKAAYAQAHEEEEGPTEQREAAKSWLRKAVYMPTPNAGKSCKDCGADNGPMDKMCHNCGGGNLVAKSKEQYKAQSGAISAPKDLMPFQTASNSGVREACGVYCVTVGGRNFYGGTLKEAQNKAKGLEDLQPGSVQEESKDLAKEIGSHVETPSWRPQTKQIPQPPMVVDPTPSTPEMPMAAVPAAPEQAEPTLVKEAPEQAPAAEQHVSGNELDAYFASDLLATDESTAKARDDEAKRLGI